MKEVKKIKINSVEIIDKNDILMYEITSHWFANKVSNKFLQKLLGHYFAYKVEKKYKRYHFRMFLRELYEKDKLLKNQ